MKTKINMLDDNKEVKISIITGYGKSKLNKRIKKIKQGGKEVIQNNRRNQKKQSGITLVALVVTILFSYDEMMKFSNSKGFLLATI